MSEARIVWPAAAMLGVAALWGGSYTIVKDAIAAMPMDDFLTWRFLLAAAAVLLVRPRAVRELGRSGVAVGVVAGLALTGAYALQTGGLLTTPASVSGFITGLLVVITPVAAAALLRERLPRSGWAATVLALAGLALLSMRGLSIGVGLDVPTGMPVWTAIVVTGLLATALAYYVQTWAQTRLSATRTAVILTMEPVFAWVTGVVVVDERVTARTALGGVLVLVAMLVAARRQPAALRTRASAGGEPPPGLEEERQDGRLVRQGGAGSGGSERRVPELSLGLPPRPHVRIGLRTPGVAG